jgi:hypothetical protein
MVIAQSDRDKRHQNLHISEYLLKLLIVNVTVTLNNSRKKGKIQLLGIYSVDIPQFLQNKKLMENWSSITNFEAFKMWEVFFCRLENLGNLLEISTEFSLEFVLFRSPGSPRVGQV